MENFHTSPGQRDGLTQWDVTIAELSRGASRHGEARGTARRSVVAFVESVTREGGTSFVPPAERIAVFDNDGTLWSEQPMYFQAFFIFDRIKALAPQHPEWKDEEPFASVLKGDVKTALAGGEHALLGA
jgi:hypothetical protein